MREAFDEVGSAIQWINNPLYIIIFADQLTAFFTNNSVFWVRFTDNVNDQMLCIAVNVSNKVITAFLARFDSVRGFIILAIRLPALRAARMAIVSIGCMGIFH